MAAFRSIALLLLSAAVVSCGGSDPSEESASLPVEDVTVVKIAGDGQTLAQHAYLYDALIVRVVDREGIGLPDLRVTFKADTGGGNAIESAALTDSNGETFFRAWLHTAGDQSVSATVEGYRPASFVVHVLPAGSEIDGVYALSYSGVLRDPSRDITLPIAASGSVLIGVANGMLFDYYEPKLVTWIVQGSFSSSNGSLDVSFRQSPDVGSRFVGTLSLKGNATGGGGSWVQLWRGVAVPDTGGLWTANRL